MSKPIEGCPQPETPIRERAWAAEQLLKLADRVETCNRVSVQREAASALRFAATLRQQPTNQPEIGSKLAGDGAVSAWREEWAGSDPGRGWYIRESTGINGRVVAYLGENIASELVREVIAAHNASLFIGKPEECEDACPPQQVCDYCQAVAPLLRAPAEQGGRGDAETVQEIVDRYIGKTNSVARYIADDLQAALAQNAQGEADCWRVIIDGEYQLFDTRAEACKARAKYEGNREGCIHYEPEPLYTHAERARVPEPTEAMVEAICRAQARESVWPDDFDQRAQRLRREAAVRGYKAALSAAPSQPEDAA